jgi:hypothetical protein
MSILVDGVSLIPSGLNPIHSAIVSSIHAIIKLATTQPISIHILDSIVADMYPCVSYG